MRTSIHNPTRRLSAALLLALLLILTAIGPALAAGPVSSSACAGLGTGVVTCELWAKAGTITLPGVASMPVWGYADSAGGTAQVPGPALVANLGDTVTVILHNDLAVATSLRLEGQSLRPDRAGAAPAGTASYTFTAGGAGTFLYEAGPVPGAQYQAALGLSGALIVRPATAGQAFADPASAYDDEALVVLSEIDPALNTSANPAVFDMRGFKPKYRLINGRAYPDTTPVATAAGNRVLLRYVNAGSEAHTMAVLGMSQTFLSLAGAELPAYRSVASQLMMAGQSADAIVAVPASASPGSKFALYEASKLLTNNGGQAFGGMLVFLEVSGTPGGGDTLGPAASALALVPPGPTNGSTPVTLNATISDIGRGDNLIAEAQFCVDASGAACVAMAAADAAFDSATEGVTTTLSTGDLALLASGSHTLYVRGRDAGNNWGSFNTIVLVLDKTGPATSGIVLTPSPTNGSVNVAIQATGDDTAASGSNIAAAEYFIDATGADGSGATLAVNVAAPIASLNGAIPAATVNALSAGNHSVYVHAQDTLGNWGAFGSATFIVDKTGPAMSGLFATPPATNGTSTVRVDAMATDSVAKVTNAELFIDTVGAPGTGLALLAKDGSFNGLTEAVYGTIPQAQANALAAGSHTIYVRAKDAAGNWGLTGSLSLISDKVKPTVSAVAAAPNPTNTTTSSDSTFTLSASADGTGTNVALAEWYEGADPGLGKGVLFAFTPAPTVALSTTIDYVARGWTPGNHTVYVRVKDLAGNWSAVGSVVVNVVYPNAIFADGFESGSFSAWSTTGGTATLISATSGSAQAGTYKMQAQITGGNSGFVQDNGPVNESTYHARFYLNPNNLAYSNNGNATAVRTVFLALNAANATTFQVQLRRTSTTGNFEVRAAVSRAGGGGGVTNTNWFSIANNAYTAIEVDWTSATSAAFGFYTAGTLRQTLTGLNTSAFKVDTGRLGPQGSLTGVSGTLYLDSFVSTRRTGIGL